MERYIIKRRVYFWEKSEYSMDQALAEVRAYSSFRSLIIFYMTIKRFGYYRAFFNSVFSRRYYATLF